MITHKYLKEVLNYNEDTGLFTWAVRKGPNAMKGDMAGSINNKHLYYTIKIDNKKYYSHCLAWFYVHGYYPENEVDHINHNQQDNRICNLREVDRSENCRNRRKPKNNSSGVTGVYFHNGNKRWRAVINIDGKQKTLGSFVDFSEAVNARKNAEVLYGYHENHGKEQ